jgi:dihydrodipicolinate synthase/N-acetylneuraminate lyase
MAFIKFDNLIKLKKKLNGPVFSIITPFNKKGLIDFKVYKKYLDFYYSHGVRIFYLMLYNSRLGILTEKEVHYLNIFTAKYLKKKYKDIIFIGAEKFEGSAEETVDRIKKLKDSGVDLFSVILGEKYYNDKQVYSHFKFINDNSKLPLLLHLQKMMSGFTSKAPVINYSIELTKKICKLSKFIAIKEDAKDLKFTKKLIKDIKNNSSIIRSGGGMSVWKNFNKIGCQSWLVGIELLDPRISFDFLKALKNNDQYFLEKLEYKIEKPFFKEVEKYGWHIFIKACLEDCGIMNKYERLPLQSVNNKDFIKIKKYMRNLRLKSKRYLKKNYFARRDLI